MKSTFYSKSFNMQLHKKTGLLLLASFAIAQMSCLKDAPNNASPSGGSNNVVEFQNSSIPVSYTSVYPQYDNGVNLKNDTGSFPVNLNYTGAVSTAPQDIKITLAVNKNALDSFNTDQGTGYELPPVDTYSFSTTATIVKGARQVTVQVHINTAAPDYDYTASYALALTITQSSYGIISSNFGTAVYSFIANNAFAGTYAATGYVFHPSSPRSIGDNYYIQTAGQFSNFFPVGDLGPNGYYFAITIPASGGAVSNWTAVGSCPPAPASGLMTADNPGGTNYKSAAPNVPGQAPWLSSTYNNTYDAAHTTFWLHYGYASGGNGQNTFTRQFYEKLVKQ
jgi:hypothetical protein